MKRLLSVIFTILLSLNMGAQSIGYSSANLNLRSGPGTYYSVMSTIPSGKSVSIIEYANQYWAKIEYKGQIGYVSIKYLVRSKTINASKRSNSSLYNNGNSARGSCSSSRKVKSNTDDILAPANATALCRDGTYSYSKNRRGTCSHHGGVSKWLY
ncbi:MAG: DUF3761 domain-containing protein [Bacteroidales bacterium]